MQGDEGGGVAFAAFAVGGDQRAALAFAFAFTFAFASDEATTATRERADDGDFIGASRASGKRGYTVPTTHRGSRVRFCCDGSITNPIATAALVRRRFERATMCFQRQTGLPGAVAQHDDDRGGDVTLLKGDKSLLEAFRRGEREALTRVFLAYADDVTRQCRGARVAEHEVESMVQDVFIKAFSPGARATYDGLRPFGAWLNTIAKHLVIDRARRDRRIELRAPDDMPVVAAVDDPRDDHDTKELQQVVETWKHELEGDDRALFQVRYEDACTMGQAATAMGWSEIRVRKHDTALRTTLLAALRRAGFLQGVRVTIGASLLKRKKTSPSPSPSPSTTKAKTTTTKTTMTMTTATKQEP